MHMEVLYILIWNNLENMFKTKSRHRKACKVCHRIVKNERGLKQVEHNSPLTEYGMNLVTLFQRVHREGGQSNFAVEKPGKPYLSQVVKHHILSYKAFGYHTPLIQG